MLGCTVKAPSTLGTFLRSFRWGHVRQLDRLSRALLARGWAAGAGPGDAPFTIDLDSTLCETYGLAKEGARQPGYSGARGYHPLLAVAAGTGDVLMARLREGRANTARGAAHFLRETVGRVRDAGASGQLTMRADSGFYNHAVVAACRALDVRFSVTIRQQPNVRTLIEAIPEEDWTPIPYWLPGGACCSLCSRLAQGQAAAVRVVPLLYSTTVRILLYSVHAPQYPEGPGSARRALSAMLSTRVFRAAREHSNALRPIPCSATSGCDSDWGGRGRPGSRLARNPGRPEGSDGHRARTTDERPDRTT